MTSQPKLFLDDGQLRPPGVPDDVRPEPGLVVQCPRCRNESLHYPSALFAVCTQPDCHYKWRRSAQLHHSEPFPY